MGPASPASGEAERAGGGASTPPYDQRFYDDEARVEGPTTSAICRLLLDTIRPRSVVDVGCGTGAFVKGFLDGGVDDVLGLEGPWIRDQRLAVDPERILVRDLTTPVDLGRSFDLAVCLEVAEHLAPEHADRLVDLLTRAAPVVAFSAALPYQGGTHHVHLRWPDYWAGKFRARGFDAYDCLRRPLAAIPGVLPWYVRNSVLYARRDLAGDPRFAALRSTRTRRVQLYAFNPEHPRLAGALNRVPPGLREAIYALAVRAGVPVS